MKLRPVLLVVCLIASLLSSAQQDKVIIRFTDASTYVPLNNVTVIDKYGNPLSKSDSAGYAALSFGLFNGSGYMLALCPGYQPDTIYSPVPTIALQPLVVNLSSATVSGNRVSRLLNALNEYVVDYDFAGDNILAATYSGSNGGKAKIFLLNHHGDVLSSIKCPEEPLSVFHSCVGNYYCVCKDEFYPITLTDTTISLKKPYNINLLPGLQQCEREVEGNMYYRLSDKMKFRVVYGMIEKDDNEFRTIARFEERDVAYASFQEYLEIMALLEAGNFHEATKMELLRKKWDRGSFAHINIPLFINSDTLSVFDFFKSRIVNFNLSGRPIDSCKISFEWKQSQKFEIIQDVARNKMYLHRYNNQAAQTIEELYLDGTVSGIKIPIQRPFAENVKVYNGDIYFLWQDSRNAATRQLFIQKME